MVPSNEDHWNFLAEKLGAEAKPEQPAAPPRAVTPPPRPKPALAPPAASQPERKPTNWSSLASSLGLEPTVEEPSQTDRGESQPASSAATSRRLHRRRSAANGARPSAEHAPYGDRPAAPARPAERDDRSDRGRRPPRGQRRDGDRRDERPEQPRPPRRDEASSQTPPSREPIFNDPDAPVDELSIQGELTDEIIDAEIVEEFVAEPAGGGDDCSPTVGDHRRAGTATKPSRDADGAAVGAGEVGAEKQIGHANRQTVERRPTARADQRRTATSQSMAKPMPNRPRDSRKRVRATVRGGRTMSARGVRADADGADRATANRVRRPILARPVRITTTTTRGTTMRRSTTWTKRLRPRPF